MPHIYVSGMGIIGSRNALSPRRRQIIAGTNIEFLQIEHIGKTLMRLESKHTVVHS